MWVLKYDSIFFHSYNLCKRHAYRFGTYKFCGVNDFSHLCRAKFIVEGCLITGEVLARHGLGNSLTLHNKIYILFLAPSCSRANDVFTLHIGLQRSPFGVSDAGSKDV